LSRTVQEEKALPVSNIDTVWFVVLHYGPIDKTVRCVDSLLRQEDVPGITSKVVIVENGYNETRDSGLADRYGSSDEVILLESAENLGFSGGNNLGYRYLKHRSPNNCSRTCAVFLNNDTEIPDGLFSEKLVGEYRHRPFDVLSPDVYDPAVRLHQSPLCRGQEIDRYAHEEFENARALLGEAYPMRMLHACKNRCVALFGSFDHGRELIAEKRRRLAPSSDWQEPLDDVVPQGSAVIFGPAFLQKSDAAFDEVTFMYFEECILKEKCDRLGLSIRYQPELQVLHHHNEITAQTLRSSTYQKRRVQAQRTVDAYQSYLTYHRSQSRTDAAETRSCS
jgi:GT2 family glycosyltransferase